MGAPCGGCEFHNFPYTSQIPVLIDGKKEVRTFNNVDDVWDVIDLLIKEVKDFNGEGTEFDIGKSVNAQLPFFTCVNNMFDSNIQRDIQRYIYCTELGVSPYKGEYGQQPFKWIDRFFFIKSAFAKKEAMQIDKQKRLMQTKGNI